MLHILVAPDSLKGSLSATQACAALQEGAGRALGERPAQFTLIPLADGGEGTVEALLHGAGGEARRITARGPLGAPVEAQWGLLPDGHAIIEMAQASGLPLVPPAQRDAGAASSYGTGQLIAAALDAGCREILIGIGGSATTDGGAGALQALGARFRDAAGSELPGGGLALRDLATIDTSGLDSRVAQSNFTVLCDVTNPLCGPQGAAHIYGPQKGATPALADALDAALARYADIAAAHTGSDRRQEPGAGAAGGLGFGLMTFLGATTRPGIAAVLEAAGFAAKLETADLVLTAEGAIDAQTRYGKALAGVAGAARVARGGHGVPVIAFGGTVDIADSDLDAMGIASAVPLPDRPLRLEECVARAHELLAAAASRALRLWLAGRTA